jgi:hypothetical protein
MILYYTELSQRMTGVASLRPRIENPVTWILSSHFSQGGEKKIERERKRQPSAWKCILNSFLWLQTTPGVYGQRRTKINPMTYMKNLKNAERMNHSLLFGGKKPILQHNVRPRNNAATSGVTREHQIRCHFTLPLQPKFGTLGVLVVCSSQETCQGDSIHMSWSSSCYGKMASRTA